MIDADDGGMQYWQELGMYEFLISGDVDNEREKASNVFERFVTDRSAQDAVSQRTANSIKQD